VGNIDNAQVKTFIDHEFVGGSDTKDIFKFKTTKGLKILNPFLPAGVQVQFIQDKDNDGVIDSNEELTPSSAILHLLPGTYFSPVRTASGASVSNAVHDLHVDFREIDTVGNSRAAAFDLGDSPNRTFNGFYVGSDDTSDVYKFSLFGVAPFLNIKAKLSGLSANANLFLTDENGNELAHSKHSGTSNESIDFTPVIGGTFFIKVARSSGNTLYNLSIDS